VTRVLETDLPRPTSRRITSPTGTALLVAAALALSEIAGLAAIVKSYEIAQTTLSNESEFAWFWLGMILIELPITALIARWQTSASVRMALLTLFGVVTFAPKLLRNPTAPSYHDEYAHWRATYDILSSGKLFQPTPIIPIIADYPGLHTATAAVVHFTGLDIWQSGTIILVLFHLAGFLGIVALARSAGMSPRASALAGILYGTNASFLYFDTEFAYESMAIPLLIWSLVCFVQAFRARPGRRLVWCVCTIFLSAGTVITHHLSSLALSLIMVLISIALSIPRLARRDGWVDTARVAWGLTLAMIAMFLVWIVFFAPATFSYLSPYLGSGLSELMESATGGNGSRELFSASLSPSWEQDSSYLLVPVMLVMAGIAVFSMRNRIRERVLPNGRRGRLLPSGPTRSIFCSLTLLGLAYFPSTVFLLSQAGAEGARRSWADSWIGLTISVSPIVVVLLNWVDNRIKLRSRIFGRTGLALLMIVLIIGGTAAGLDAVYRFPGPYLFGSDTRSNTPELDSMTQWFLKRFGPGNNVVTDRQTGLQIASAGLQNTAFPSAGFPTYDLYSDPPGQPIGPGYLLSELLYSKYLYLVVDERMATDVPVIGVYFEPDEPVSYISADGKSLFAGKLGKFDGIQWMYKVFASDNYSVYRTALPPGNIKYQSHPVKFQGKLSVG
jgi:hypothetical protein